MSADIVSDPLGTTLALRNDGTLLVWGSWFSQPTDIASTPRAGTDYPVRGVAAPANGKLPRIVRLSVVANFAVAIGADNVTYRFVPGRTVAQHGWDAGQMYAGVPAPF